MGLAATQARFLAITSRKANLEFQSMQIAQQKLSLTRELEEVADEYQAAINKTVLVWDVDGSGDYLYNLSYSLLMTPSYMNGYTPYLLARKDGKIALNSAYASAAKAAGINDDGSLDTSKERAYINFINALQGSNAISASDANVAKAVGLIADAGMGGELVNRETANNMYLTSMISYIDLVTEGYGNEALANSLTFDMSDCGLNTKYKKDDGASALLMNGNYYDTSSSFNLADLLEYDITLLVNKKQDYTKICQAMKTAITTGSQTGSFSLLLNNSAGNTTDSNGKTVTGWYDQVMGDGAYEKLSSSEKALLEFFTSLTQGMYALLMPDDPSDTDLNAFAIALDDLVSRISNSGNNSYVAVKKGDSKSEDKAKSAVVNAEDYNCWVQYDGEWALSLSNLTEAFLTTFINAKDEYEDGYYVADYVRDSYYVTDDSNYIYTVNTGEGEQTDLWIAEFYSIIFNEICQNGWYENEQVEDNDYLDNAVKNGQLFIVSQGSDGYYYQSRYARINGEHLSEYTDSDAISQAEVEYTRKKSKINYKEEELEIKADQLDAELAALTTEYDTVKSMIAKNIEKTFTIFQS